MTDYPHDPYTPQGVPQQPAPGGEQWGQPEYGQPQYGQPEQQYGQQQYGQQQPQYGDQQYAQQGYYGQPYAGAPTPPAKSRRTKTVLLSSAAVVVLAAGGVATYAAVSSSSGGGASSPKAAVQTALADINNSDLIGLLDDLAPGERRAMAKPISDLVDGLKKSDVLAGKADAKKVSGVEVQTSNFTYAPDTVKLTDSVQVVRVTGGTLRVTGDAAKLPLSKDFLDAVVPGGLHSKKTQTLDIAQELRRSGESSVRIAAQQVDGHWYPSLFYTIADNAVGNGKAPSASDAIPATGSRTPEGAVTSLINSIVRGDVAGAVGMLSPDEMGVLHDYGYAIFPRNSGPASRDFTVSNLAATARGQSDGTSVVTLKSATLDFGEGHTISVVSDGTCFTTTISGKPPTKTCPGSSGPNSIASVLQGAFGVELTPRQVTALNDLTAAVGQTGVVVSQSGGKWFVAPVRSVLTEMATIVGGLKQGDLLALIAIGRH